MKKKSIEKAASILGWAGIASVILTGLWLLFPGLLNWLFTFRLWIIGVPQVIGVLLLIHGVCSVIAPVLKK